MIFNNIYFNLSIHPGATLLLLFAVHDFLPRDVRNFTSVLAPFVSFILFLLLYFGNARNNIYYLDLFYISNYTAYFVLPFLLILLCGNIFAIGNNQDSYKDIKYAFLYSGAAIFAVLSNNLLVIFACIELMMVGAVMLIFNGRNRLSRCMGLSYFKIHILAGTLFFISALIHYIEYGDFYIISSSYQVHSSDSTLLHIMYYSMLISLLMNIAMPPFSYWLTEGYASSSVSGGVFLPAYTTKVAIFLLMQIFVADKVLIYVGIFMGCYGIMYAVLENNLRRIINYLIISHLGMMCIGIGIGEIRSVFGALLIASNGIVYTSLTMVCIGLIMQFSGKKRYYDISIPVGRNYILFVCSIIALGSFSDLPFTSGYSGKWFLYNSEYIASRPWLAHIITFIASGIILSAFIKIPMFIFAIKSKNNKSHDAKDTIFNPLKKTSLYILALVSIICGIFSGKIFGFVESLTDSLAVNYIFLVLGIFITVAMLNRFISLQSKVTLLDLDYIYRVLIFGIYKIIKNGIYKIYDAFSRESDRLRQGAYDISEKTFGTNGVFAYIKSQNVYTVIFILILVTLLLYA